MANFNFYLNRQGIRGNKGEKGDTGFAPIIEVDTNTAAEYKLKIITEAGEFITDNLRGSAVTDNGGTYMRYDSETQTMYAAPADRASENQAGIVYLADDSAMQQFDIYSAVTPKKLVDNLPFYFKSSDSSISITQDPDTLKIDLKTGVVRDISRLEARVSANELLLGSHQISINNLDRDKVDKVAGKGLSTNDFTDADKSKLDSSLQPTSVDGTTIGLNSGGQLTLLAQIPTVPTNISAFTNDSGYITLSALNSYATENFVTSQGYITSSALTPYVLSSSLATVATTGDYADLINTPTAYSSGLGIDINNANQISVKVDGNTVQFNANGELEAQTYTLPTASATTLGGVKVDGTTITIDNNGVISSSGGSITIDQTYNPTSVNAQSGVAINGANFIQNQAGRNTSLEIKNAGSNYQRCVGILGTVNGSGAISIGYQATAPTGGVTIGQNAGLSSNSNYGVAIGDSTRAGYASVAIGSNGNTGATANGIGSIQLGSGTNNDSATFQVGKYKMLDLSTGFIPAARIAIDGNTITINSSGQLVAAGGSTPTNMVTTDTEQTISGHKIFSDASTEIAGDLYITQWGTSYIRMGDDTAYATPVLTMDDTNDILTVGDTGKFLKLKAYDTVVISNQRGNELTVGYDTLTYKKSDDTVVDLLALEARIAALEALINGGNA